MEDNLSWVAPEFEYKEKTHLWYWISMAVAILVLAGAVWQKNFLLAVFVVISEVLVIVLGGKAPREIEFTLHGDGLTIAGRKSYPYADIESFSVDDRGDGVWVDFIINFKKKIRSSLKVAAPRDMESRIKEFLGQRLKEVEFEASMFDALERFIGF